MCPYSHLSLSSSEEAYILTTLRRLADESRATNTSIVKQAAKYCDELTLSRALHCKLYTNVLQLSRFLASPESEERRFRPLVDVARGALLYFLKEDDLYPDLAGEDGFNDDEWVVTCAVKELAQQLPWIKDGVLPELSPKERSALPNLLSSGSPTETPELLERAKTSAIALQNNQSMAPFAHTAHTDAEELIRRLEQGILNNEQAACALSALSYFVRANDAIPDELGPMGYLDDAYILRRAIETIEHDSTSSTWTLPVHAEIARAAELSQEARVLVESIADRKEPPLFRQTHQALLNQFISEQDDARSLTVLCPKRIREQTFTSIFSCLLGILNKTSERDPEANLDCDTDLVCAIAEDGTSRIFRWNMDSQGRLVLYAKKPQRGTLLPYTRYSRAILPYCGVKKPDTEQPAPVVNDVIEGWFKNGRHPYIALNRPIVLVGPRKEIIESLRGMVHHTTGQPLTDLLACVVVNDRGELKLIESPHKVTPGMPQIFIVENISSNGRSESHVGTLLTARPDLTGKCVTFLLKWTGLASLNLSLAYDISNKLICVSPLTTICSAPGRHFISGLSRRVWAWDPALLKDLPISSTVKDMQSPLTALIAGQKGRTIHRIDGELSKALELLSLSLQQSGKLLPPDAKTDELMSRYRSAAYRILKQGCEPYPDHPKLITLVSIDLKPLEPALKARFHEYAEILEVISASAINVCRLLSGATSTPKAQRLEELLATFSTNKPYVVSGQNILPQSIVRLARCILRPCSAKSLSKTDSPVIYTRYTREDVEQGMSTLFDEDSPQSIWVLYPCEEACLTSALASLEYSLSCDGFSAPTRFASIGVPENLIKSPQLPPTEIIESIPNNETTAEPSTAGVIKELLRQLQGLPSAGQSKVTTILVFEDGELMPITTRYMPLVLEGNEAEEDTGTITMTVTRKPAESLRAGDIVVARRCNAKDADFWDIVVEKIKETEGERYRIVQSWRESLRTYQIDHGLDFQTLAHQLSKAGVKRGNQTIRKWLEDSDLLAPQKLEDLQAIAKAIGNPTLQASVPSIFEEAQILRDILRRKGREIGQMLWEAFHRGQSSIEILGMTFDLQEAFSIQTVQSVEPTSISLPTYSVNRAISADDIDRGIETI